MSLSSHSVSKLLIGDMKRIITKTRESSELVGDMKCSFSLLFVTFVSFLFVFVFLFSSSLIEFSCLFVYM